MRATSPTSSTGLRARALVATLYRGGLRISEALALMPGDLNPATGELRIADGKGHRARTVGLDDGAIAVIENWRSRRADLGIGGRSRLLCTLRGGPMGDSYARRHIAALARKAGIEKRVHPHGLRHTMAHELAMEGQPMPLIRDQLGHSSLATTDTYLRHIAPAELVKTMKGRMWTP